MFGLPNADRGHGSSHQRLTHGFGFFISAIPASGHLVAAAMLCRRGWTSTLTPWARRQRVPEVPLQFESYWTRRSFPAICFMSVCVSIIMFNHFQLTSIEMVIGCHWGIQPIFAHIAHGFLPTALRDKRIDKSLGPGLTCAWRGKQTTSMGSGWIVDGNPHETSWKPDRKNIWP